jgi:single-stranded-DNA-specific exonuclease
MAPEELYPRLEADVVIELQDLTPKFVRRLDRMAPFGPAHPRPRFVAYNLRPERASIIGRDRAHLRLRLCQGTTGMEAMGFSMAAQWEQLQQAHAGEQLAALFVPAFNTYQGQTSLRLELKDLKPMTAVELG